MQPDPTKRWVSKDILHKINLDQTQIGQIFPLKLKKSKRQQKVDDTIAKNSERINESLKYAAGHIIRPNHSKKIYFTPKTTVWTSIYESR